MPGKVANTLINGLASMGIFSTEPAAIQGWTNAWNTYFIDAVCNGIPINAAILPVAKSAMIGALAGLSGSMGTTILQAAIFAWWGALAPPASVFAGALAIVPPPGLAAVKADIEAAANYNRDNKLSTNAAFTNIVSGGVPPPPGMPNLGLHILNLTGALATFPLGITAPIL
jgi:hypothetical protein